MNWPVVLEDILLIWKWNWITGKEKFLSAEEISVLEAADKLENQQLSV